jgi:hypothetical protein
MNERTLELAKQAGLKVESWMTNPPKPFQILGSTEQFEKFAELIVRECMTMCDETQSDYFKHRKASNDFTDKNIYAEGEAASDIIKYKMKKHFGVEK